jgi:DNA (cytosine-5)-methyltransferase 1
MMGCRCCPEAIRQVVVKMFAEAQLELRQMARPAFEVGPRAFTLVDLFAGCGGLSLGVAQACRSVGAALKVVLAVDFDISATEVYRDNFPLADVRHALVDKLFDGQLGHSLSSSEETLVRGIQPGSVDFLVAGPPCQGHSNLNNHTRRDDPKNALYLRAVRAIEVLRPSVAMIENVPAVLNDKTDVVSTARAQLREMGYTVQDAVVGLGELGVAQKRRRHVLIASVVPTLDVNSVLRSMAAEERAVTPDLAWAIADLIDAEPDGMLNRASIASADNAARMKWLVVHDAYDLPNTERPKCHWGDHSYKSMYGRLKWDEPAQTITSGFGSMGQGRYVHPEAQRTITPHEAARIQGFPDYFRFTSAPTRGQLATMIGNAAPPALARHVFSMGIAAMQPAEMGLSRQPRPRNIIMERSDAVA